MALVVHVCLGLDTLGRGWQGGSVMWMPVKRSEVLEQSGERETKTDEGGKHALHNGICDMAYETSTPRGSV